MIGLWLALAAVAQDSPWGELDGTEEAKDGAEDGAEPAEAQPTAVTATLVVSVTQREEAADAMVAAADELGGWFQSRTTSDLSLRVPVGEVDALVEAAADQGKLLRRDVTRDDVGQQIADTEGRLAAREEVLERYYEVLEEAGPKSVVAVEQQIVGAITIIEQLKGQLRVLRDRATYGRVDVAFQFRDRAAPARTGSSSFAWLNTLNMQDVLWGMRRSRPDWRTRGVSVPAPPEGFSAWRRQRRYRAASPDDVLFRVRTERHKPQAEVDFWAEATHERMVAAGYSVTTEQQDAAGFLIELAAPMGTEDWTYLISVQPAGRRLVIAEAVGEVSALEARRDAIIAAMDAISL